jgi:hypothetical protein
MTMIMRTTHDDDPEGTTAPLGAVWRKVFRCVAHRCPPQLITFTVLISSRLFIDDRGKTSIELYKSLFKIKEFGDQV